MASGFKAFNIFELRRRGLTEYIGALIIRVIRVVFLGPVYCNYSGEHQNSIGNHLGPYITGLRVASGTARGWGSGFGSGAWFRVCFVVF